ncbi:uncharacterized protein [Rhodnius prolixus]|uniref:uncharacterized protein n=1 Tax=Rhodnius prolixus TaxID=13249 RepID=UPI003D18D0C1
MLKFFKEFEYFNGIFMISILYQCLNYTAGTPPQYGSKVIRILSNGFNSNPFVEVPDKYAKEEKGIGFCEPPKVNKPSDCETSVSDVNYFDDINYMLPPPVPPSVVVNKQITDKSDYVNLHKPYSNIPLNVTKILSINIETIDNMSKFALIEQMTLLFLPFILAFLGILLLLHIKVSSRRNKLRPPFAYFYSKSA